MSNKFVKDFTKQETEGVEKLKAKLPEILKAAFDNETPYTLWNVKLDKDSTDERLSVLLVKFLRAREHNVEIAAEMLTNTLRWRKEFKADEILEESFDQEVFGSVGYTYETDKDGRPVCYNFYGDLDQEKVFGDVQRFVRWRVQLMEKSVQLVDLEKVDSMIQVHDYNGVSMFGRSANSKAATKEIIKIMQDNYPEYLALKYFVNIPWWGSKIYNLIKSILPETTTRKFRVCSSDELLDTLTQQIPKENLPAVYVSGNGKKKEVSSSKQPEQPEQVLAESSKKEEEQAENEQQSEKAEQSKVTDELKKEEPEGPAAAIEAVKA
ncbi:CRAL-TRIO domain-containing protein [Syncephalastrum racemosum]|uniref:Phosphatidylinositol transfer protein SFH5 n=1 Tax=Syncephalastrum racemosum TaxID=13706 RepID=A0A1X2HII7_SYNRA|nr:CRAL-TRIO domain-containing protein [Syncephalastrum racemosum]